MGQMKKRVEAADKRRPRGTVPPDVMHEDLKGE